MRIFLFILFLISNFSSHAQYENSWRIKKTFQKTSINNDTLLNLISFEERDLEGKLILKADFIPRENLQYLTRYSYRDTFLIKKIITEQKIIENDTITSVDSILREISSDFHPIIEDSVGKDDKDRFKMSARKLEKGHWVVLTTHFDTRYDSHLRSNASGQKMKTDVSFYQLMHEYFIEYDSAGRKVTEYSSIDKWEYDNVKFRKLEYDQNGNITKVLFANDDKQLENEFDLESSILNLYLDTLLTEKELMKKNNGEYSAIIVYNEKGNKAQEMNFYLHSSSHVQSECVYLYDDHDRLFGIQCISGENLIEKNFYFLDKNSFKVSKIESFSQYKNEPAEIESENFKYNDHNHLLIEQYKEKNGIKSNWFLYEYIFH